MTTGKGIAIAGVALAAAAVYIFSPAGRSVDGGALLLATFWIIFILS